MSSLKLLPPMTHARHAYERANTIALKNEIAMLLAPYGDAGPVYWRTLQDYMQARLTREELMLAIRRIFSDIPKSARSKVLNHHLKVDDPRADLGEGFTGLAADDLPGIAGVSATSAPATNGTPQPLTNGAAKGDGAYASTSIPGAPVFGTLPGDSEPVSVSTRRLFIQKHNTFLMAVLYNTAQLAPPPAGQRHVGWLKRRGGPGAATVFAQRRRRFLRDTVLALSKRERERIKALAAERAPVALDAYATLRLGAGTTAQAALAQSARPNVLIHSTGLPMNTVMSLAMKKQSGVALPYPVDVIINDYKLCLNAGTCRDARGIPGADALRDRMAMLAYEAGLPYGVAGATAVFLECAVNVYLNKVIALLVDGDERRHRRLTGTTGAEEAGGGVSGGDKTGAGVSSSEKTDTEDGTHDKTKSEEGAHDKVPKATQKTATAKSSAKRTRTKRGRREASPDETGEESEDPKDAEEIVEMRDSDSEGTGLRRDQRPTQSVSPSSRSPITLQDIADLLAERPQLQVSPHVGAVERALTLGPFLADAQQSIDAFVQEMEAESVEEKKGRQRFLLSCAETSTEMGDAVIVHSNPDLVELVDVSKLLDGLLV